MSRSKLRDKFMRRCYTGRSRKSWNGDVLTRNPHRLDEMPKNTPSKMILMHCSAVVEWLEDSISVVGGHSRPAGGHRRVSGLVRASLKEETRELMQEQLAEYDDNNCITEI